MANTEADVLKAVDHCTNALTLLDQYDHQSITRPALIVWDTVLLLLFPAIGFLSVFSIKVPEGLNLGYNQP